MSIIDDLLKAEPAANAPDSATTLGMLVGVNKHNNEVSPLVVDSYDKLLALMASIGRPERPDPRQIGPREHAIARRSSLVVWGIGEHQCRSLAEKLNVDFRYMPKTPVIILTEIKLGEPIEMFHNAAS